MFRTNRSIANYRTFAGVPKRGVCEPAKAALAWVQLVRKRSAALAPLGQRAFRSTAETFCASMRTLDDALQIDQAVESFALTNEAIRRTLGWQYHDVQLVAGFALASGVIAEIQTGEGKTIIAALPAILHAWCGRGVHVATTNAYLSSRDHETLQPVYAALGLTSACLQPQQDPAQKRAAYACDVTHGPGYEFGFDFLRDQVAARQRRRQPLGDRYLRRLEGRPEDHLAPIQRGLSFAIVDEADSVMIDEAVTPLVVSGDPEQHQTDPAVFENARTVACGLQVNVDYRIDPAARGIELTEDGWARARQRRQPLLNGRLGRRWQELVVNALRAEHRMRRDVDYVVADGRVILVDPHTGRLHPERRWNGGLQQAVEIKEGVAITPESVTQGRITRQRFLGFYPKLSGMTGTALGGEQEFREFYRLPVVRIATHRPCLRRRLSTRVFDTTANKLNAIVGDVRNRIGNGQPILIGAASIEQSRQVADRLRFSAIDHDVLNGVQDEHEAAIIARAGRAGRVTVATNMAGRGTDIGLDDAARTAGGLHVIGMQMHASGRVDRQLAGRAARHGDPGSCQFYVAADDELLRGDGSALATRIRDACDATGECHLDVSAALNQLQRRAEGQAWERRRQMVAHDDWFESVQSSFARRA